MPRPESFPIDKIYVSEKRRKDLKPELVQEIAESILEVGQQVPILVRSEKGRVVLVEGLHRFEACKALGEDTIIATGAASAAVTETRPAEHLRKPSRSQGNRRTSGSTPRTLSEWLTQQKRDGGRY